MGLLAAVFAARAWRGTRQAIAARTWTKTLGQVISSGVVKELVRLRNRPGLGYRMAPYFEARVVYEYRVNGVTYQSDRQQFGERTLSSDVRDEEARAAQFPPGRVVVVYYNPANPAEAALDPRPGAASVIYWVMAGLMLIMAISVLAVLLTVPPANFG